MPVRALEGRGRGAVSVSRHSCEGRNPEGPGGRTPLPTHIAGALRDSVRPEPVEGFPPPPRSPRASPHPPTVVPRKREPRAGARCGAVSVSRHSCEGRNPEGRGAVTRHSTCKRHRPPTVVPAFAGTQGRGTARGASASRTSHTRHRRTRKPGGAPSGGPPPTHIAGAIRTLSAAGPSPSLELPTPATVVPAKAGIQRCAGRRHAPTNPHRRRASRFRRSLSGSQGPSATTSPRASHRTPAIVVPAKAGIQRCAGRRHAPTNPRASHRSPPPSFSRKREPRAGARRGALPDSNPNSKHPDTTPLPPRRPLPYPPPMHHARKHTGHKPTTPRMPRQPAQNASENTQNPLVSDQTSRICRGQFCRRLVSHIAKSPLKQFESSTAEEPPGGRPSPRDAICNKPETNTLRRRATLNAT